MSFRAQGGSNAGGGGNAPPAKKSSRINFAGVCSLPRDKAQGLSTALQQIVLKLVNVYNSCEDGRINIDQKYKTLGSLSSLQSPIHTVATLVQEQIDITPQDLRPSLIEKSNKITNAVNSLNTDLHEYSDNDPNRGAIAHKIFTNLLCVVETTIDLLKSADQGVASNVGAMATDCKRAVQAVADATTAGQLTQATSDLTEHSVDLIKKMQKRREVLPDHARNRGDLAINTLRTGLGAFVTAKRHLIASGSSHSSDFSNHHESVEEAVNTLVEVASVSPEFSVTFDVEYTDNPLGAALSGLMAALDHQSEPDLLGAAKKLITEAQDAIRRGEDVSKSLPQAEAANVLQACNDAKTAVASVVRLGREALDTREKGDMPKYYGLEKRLLEAARALKAAIDQIPIKHQSVKVIESSALVDAARKMMVDFGLLLQP
eukprot:TRINITY_DN2581_c0_g1_i1.p1 TRINITY_DN2581_c0_g1~~TRINITY_DN2581_c0_g1_i1.p1  ORF type:complete len:452 (-),score=138.80 TRINITY_DN2581_c0_g1_i1:110-1402(-)